MKYSHYQDFMQRYFSVFLSVFKIPLDVETIQLPTVSDQDSLEKFRNLKITEYSSALSIDSFTLTRKALVQSSNGFFASIFGILVVPKIGNFLITSGTICNNESGLILYSSAVKIGSLEYFIVNDTLDYSLWRISSSIKIDPDLLLTTPLKYGKVVPGDNVFVTGAVTSDSKGYVKALFPVSLRINSEDVELKDHFRVVPASSNSFSYPNDDGSAVFGFQKTIVGMIRTQFLVDENQQFNTLVCDAQAIFEDIIHNQNWDLKAEERKWEIVI